ncbi:MAG TPA: hypothetical protein VF840_06410, partial [Terriglobales bacterium]
AGMTLNSYTFAACTPSGQVIVCTLGSIAANASITVTITATTSVVGTAFVTGVVVYDGTDPNPINILLNSTQSTVTTVGTFSAGEIVGLTVDGSVCVSFTDWCTFGDGSLQKPVVSTHGLETTSTRGNQVIQSLPGSAMALITTGWEALITTSIPGNSVLPERPVQIRQIPRPCVWAPSPARSRLHRLALISSSSANPLHSK